MSLLPRDRQRTASTTTGAASSHEVSMVDDEVFREFQQKLRSAGHVTNLATKQFLLQKFLADWSEEAACELHCGEQEEANACYKTDVDTSSGHGSGIVSLLSNAFSLSSEVAFQQDEQSAASSMMRVSLGAHRSSICSAVSTSTSCSNSRCASSTTTCSLHVYAHEQSSQELSPNDAASRQEMFRQSRRLSEQFSTSISKMSGVEPRRCSMPSNTVASNMAGTIHKDGGSARMERRRSSLLSTIGGRRSSIRSCQNIRRLSSIGSARSVSTCIGSSGPLHLSSLRDVDEVSMEGNEESTTSRSSEHSMVIPNASVGREIDSSSALNNANREFKISLSAANYPLICGWSSDDDDACSSTSTASGANASTFSSTDDEKSADGKKNGDSREGGSGRVLQFSAHGSRAA